MMGSYGYGSMMGGGFFSTFGLLTWIVWFVVGVLLAIWLWRQITERK